MLKLWFRLRSWLQDWALDGITRHWDQRIREFLAQPPEVRRAYLERIDAGETDGLPEAVRLLMRRWAT